jgi:hypothetical protein
MDTDTYLCSICQLQTMSILGSEWSYEPGARTISTPPAYKRRRAEKTLAEVYEIHNAEFSTLHRLPGELVLEVADWLDAADIVSLHLSC